MDIQQNKISIYTQLYDYLKNIKLVEYLSNKRNIIHDQLFTNSVKRLIKEVNNPDTTNSVAIAIQKQIELYNIYQLYNVVPSLEQNIDNHLLNKHNINPEAVSNLLLQQYLNGEYDRFEIMPFNNDNFKFIEYKDKAWYKPSQITIVYNHSLVKNEKGNYVRLVLGPYSLSSLWENKYILSRDFNKVIKPDTGSKFVIEYIDYVNGLCIINDKINNTDITVDLDYLLNMNDYEYNHLYDQMFLINKK